MESEDHAYAKIEIHSLHPRRESRVRVVLRNVVLLLLQPQRHKAVDVLRPEDLGELGRRVPAPVRPSLERHTLPGQVDLVLGEVPRAAGLGHVGEEETHDGDGQRDVR